MNKVIFISSIVVILFSSCVTLQTISFERLQAADVSFPERVRTVGVVNCAPGKSTIDKEKDSSSRVLEGDGEVAAEMLAQEIAATDYFDKVVICDSILRGDRICLLENQMDSLIQTMDVDLILAIESVGIQLKETSLFQPEYMFEVPIVDGVVSPVVKAYISNRDTPIFTVSKSDTIYWAINPTLTWNQITQEASEFSATILVSHLLPHWVEVSRCYFDGGSADMRDAGIYVREQNWEEAAKIWRKMFEKKSGKSKVYAAYNLALYSEMKDDIEGARKYLDEAMAHVGQESAEGALITLYQVQLDELLVQNQRLKLQMRRFENIF